MAKKLTPHEAAAMILKQRMEQARARDSGQARNAEKSRSRNNSAGARKA